MTEQIFVAREHELAQLNEFLDRILAGQAQVCFVTGEAGSGKTALVTEFARRAQEAHADLLVAHGTCNAQTGLGDPYLPFREVLGLLTGDVEAKLAQGAITEENASRLCFSHPLRTSPDRGWPRSGGRPGAGLPSHRPGGQGRGREGRLDGQVGAARPPQAGEARRDGADH